MVVEIQQHGNVQQGYNLLMDLLIAASGSTVLNTFSSYQLSQNVNTDDAQHGDLPRIAASTLGTNGGTGEGRSTRRQRISQDLRDRFVRLVQSTPGSSILVADRFFGLPVSTSYSIMRRVEV